jgi:hypothetical protein
MKLLRVLLVGALTTVLTTVGVGLGAGAAEAGTAVAPNATSLTGNWTDNGSAMPSIIQGGVGGDNLVVNMSFANRPTAFGKVTSATTFFVTFPDAGRFTGTILGGGDVLQWSNGSVWRRVFTGQLVHDINGSWTDGISFRRVTNTGGYVRVTLDNGTQVGVGFARNASTIEVSFTAGGTFLGTVDPNGFIRWSNNTTWSHPILH